MINSELILVLTLGVSMFTSKGATLPGMVANIFPMPYISPEYLYEQEMKYNRWP